MAARLPRILLTKSFIDSHDRATKTLAVALRDAAMEVILIDYETPADVVSIAIDEDVDVIGISFMSGGQVQVTTAVMQLLREARRADLPVVVGGTIRPFDVDPLTEAGVRRVYRGGKRLDVIVDELRTIALETRQARTAVD